MTHLTRALIRVQRGDEAGARADAAAVEAVAPEAADSLLSYLRVMFRPFEFVPARETLVPDPLADETPEIAQTLTAVQRIAGVYATRLSRVRAGLTTMLGSKPSGTRLRIASDGPPWNMPQSTRNFCPPASTR